MGGVTVRRLFLLVVLALGGAVALGDQAAFGCSCVGVPAKDQLAAADGAFVGTVIERRDPRAGAPGPQSSADPVDVVFRVERAYKGDLGDEVVVQTNRFGASCGIEAEVGERIGLVMDREDGRWTGGLCGQVDPEELARAARPGPPVTGEGPVRFLLAGNFGSAGLLALDADGAVLGSAKGSAPERVAPCPDGRRALTVSALGAGLAVQDLATMQSVRGVPLRGRALAVDCRTADARIGVALIDGFHEGGTRLVRFSRDGARTLRRIPAREAAFAGRWAWVAKRGSRPGLLRVDAITGRARRMADGRFEAVAAAPGGRRAAALDARGRLVVVDADGVRRGPRSDAPVWAGARTLVARSDRDGRLRTYDDELDVLRRPPLDPQTPALLAAREGHLVAVADGRLVTAGARTGGRQTRAKLPQGEPQRLLAIDPAPAQGAGARSRGPCRR